MIYNNLLRNQLEEVQFDVKLLLLNLEGTIKSQGALFVDDRKAHDAVSQALVELNLAALYIRAK